MKVEVDVLGSLSTTVLMVSVDIKRRLKKVLMCESRGGRSRLLVHNSPYGLCGRKATFQEAPELCESRGARPGPPLRNSLYGLCGRKATLNLNGNPLLSILREFAFFCNSRPS